MNKSLLIFALFITMAPLAAQNRVSDTTTTHSIERVVVTSYRNAVPLTDAPTKVEIISAQSIAQSVATNITELLASGINAQIVDMQGATGGIGFRGFAPSAMGTTSYTKILVNGMPAPTLNSSAIMSGGAVGVEVLKGPYSALYGSGAMSGVVNILTPRSSGEVAGRVALSFGSFNTYGLNASVGGSLSAKVNFDIYANAMLRTRDYKTGGSNILHMSGYEREVMDPNSYNKRYDSTRMDSESVGIRLGWNISPKWRVDLYTDLFGISRALSNGNFWAMENREDRSMFRHTYRLLAQGDIGRHKLRISPLWSDERSSYDSNGAYGLSSSRYNYRTLGGEISDCISLGNQSITVGVDNLSQKFISHMWDGVGAAAAPYNPDYLNIQTGIFAQASLWLFDGKLTGIGGVRYDNIIYKTLATPHLDVTANKHSFNTIDGNGALRYRPLSFLSFRASVGTAFLAPDAYKMTGEYKTAYGVYRGNVDLKPEESLSYDFAITLEDKRGRAGADVTIFFTNHKNLIVYDYSTMNDGYTTFANADKASMAGGEYMLWADFGRIFSKRYSLRVNASYTGLFWASVTTNQLKAKRKYVSRNCANISLSYIDKRLSTTISARYMGHRIEDNFIRSYDYATGGYKPFVTSAGVEVRPSLVNESLITTPNFVVVDFVVSYNFTRLLSATVKLANLTNELYFERDGYYMPGRNISVGLGIKF